MWATYPPRHALRETRPMDSAPDHLVAIARLQAELLQSLPPSLALGPFARAGSPRRAPFARAGCSGRRPHHAQPRYHQGHFSARHHLTPEKPGWRSSSSARSPLPWPHAQQKRPRGSRGSSAASAMVASKNTRWGRTMLARRWAGRGRPRRHLLREIAPKGGHAAAVARARKKATAHWEQTGQVLALEQAETDPLPLLQPLDAWQERPFMAW